MRRDFQVLVVGSGPAGMAAATRAAEAGLKVGLIDDNPNPGGQIWRTSRGGDGRDRTHGGGAAAWYRRLLGSSVERMQGWSVFASTGAQTGAQMGTQTGAQQGAGRVLAEAQGGSGEVGCAEDVLEISFETLVLATGARERFLPFPGWTLPNSMGVGGLQAMYKAGLPVQGRRVVIAGSGPLLLAVAATLKAAGAEVVCICEQASMRQMAPFAAALLGDPGKLVQGLRYRAATWGTPFYTSCWPIEAMGTDCVRSVAILHEGRRREIDCDYLACGFHLVLNTELAEVLGCAVGDGAVVVDRLQRTSVEGVFCAGEPTGIGGLERSLLEGEIAGLAAAGRTAEAEKLARKRRRTDGFSRRLAGAFALRPELRQMARADTVVCRCEDVAFGELAQQPSWRAAKLHTRCGMGPCQGRICGAATNFLFGWEEHSVRPPILPARVASLGCAPSIPHLAITDRPEIP